MQSFAQTAVLLMPVEDREGSCVFSGDARHVTIAVVMAMKHTSDSGPSHAG